MFTKSFQDSFVALSVQQIPFIPLSLDAWKVVKWNKLLTTWLVFIFCGCGCLNIPLTFYGAEHIYAATSLFLLTLSLPSCGIRLLHPSRNTCPSSGIQTRHYQLSNEPHPSPTWRQYHRQRQTHRFFSIAFAYSPSVDCVGFISPVQLAFASFNPSRRQLLIWCRSAKSEKHTTTRSSVKFVETRRGRTRTEISIGRSKSTTVGQVNVTGGTQQTSLARWPRLSFCFGPFSDLGEAVVFLLQFGNSEIRLTKDGGWGNMFVVSFSPSPRPKTQSYIAVQSNQRKFRILNIMQLLHWQNLPVADNWTRNSRSSSSYYPNIEYLALIGISKGQWNLRR